MSLQPVAISADELKPLPPARPRTRPMAEPERCLPPARHRTREAPEPQSDRSGEALLDHWRAGFLQTSTITQREEVKLRRYCRKQVALWQDKIARLQQAEASHKAEGAARQMRRKLGVRLHVLLEASRKAVPYDPTNNPCLEALRIARLKFAFRELKDINAFDRQADALMRMKRKSSGRGFRPICSFDAVDHARQNLLNISIHPFASFHSSQTLLRRGEEGRGVMVARKAFLSILEGSGEEHVCVQIDVKNFFESIDHQWLESHLPLGRGIIRKYVHTGEMNLEFEDTACKEIRHSRTARRGIPQGSALSQLIAEMVMADVLRGLAIPPGVAFVTYSDNLGVVMPRGCEAAIEELFRHAFEQHGAGPFKLTFSTPVPATECFHFLGMSFAVEDGVARAVVPETAWGSLLSEIGGDVLVAGMEELDRLESKLIGSIAQWKMWSGADAILDEGRSLIHSQRQVLSQFR